MTQATDSNDDHGSGGSPMSRAGSPNGSSPVGSKNRGGTSTGAGAGVGCFYEFLRRVRALKYLGCTFGGNLETFFLVFRIDKIFEKHAFKWPIYYHFVKKPTTFSKSEKKANF